MIWIMFEKDKSLKNKNVLITGASDGIGKSTAIIASKLGAKVIMIARDEEKLQNVMYQLEDGNHSWYSYDLKKVEGIDNLVTEIVGTNGLLDGFVHCAGISATRPLKLTKFDFLHDMMLINFYSFFELCRCISKKGNYQKGLSIVGMSSISGIRGFKGKTAYSATKAALDGAIRSMAKELGEKGIRINSIIACMIKTKMYERYKNRTGKEMDDSHSSIYSLGIGEPIDIANAIIYLLSDYSRIITGIGWVIDSGTTS
ncbi:MAG: SDR family oxidoreductase [Bacteroidales bacterium]|nr:SDR family oxidoreductase [Bacteroidales bacterium]